MIKTTMVLRRTLLAILCGAMVAGTGLAPMGTMTVYAEPAEGGDEGGDSGDRGDSGDSGDQGGSGTGTTYEEPSTSEPRIRYAVQIYGIGVDTVANGSDPDDAEFEYKSAGLTFGPAVGDEYLGYARAGRNHVATGTTDKGNVKRCVHDDSWETIIAWNIEDPWVYEDCITQGCTKSIALELDGYNSDNSSDSGKVFNTNKAYVDSDNSSNNRGASVGDGPSVLYWELQETARKWTDNGAHDASLNWANSRMRAMLNGKQRETSSSYGGTEYTADNSMLSALPEILRNAIGYKEIDYAVASNQKNTEKCYDRLWLFAANELYSASDLADYTRGIYNYENEGERYVARTGSWSPQNSSSAGRMTSSTGYRTRNTEALSGVGFTWWLRSRVYTTFTNADYCYSATVSTTGLMQADTDNSSAGVAFGFTLSRDPDPAPPVDPGDPSSPSSPSSSDDSHDDGGSGSSSGTTKATTTGKAQVNGTTNADGTVGADGTLGADGTGVTDDGAGTGNIGANGDLSTGNINANGDLNGNAIGATGDDSQMMVYGFVAIAAAMMLVVRYRAVRR